MFKSVRVCIGPDLLDQMTPDDPKAIASRRDIKRINAVMFQAAVMRGAISRCDLASPKRILDLGGGDATFTLSVARRMRPQWRGVELVIVDRMDVVESQTKRDFEKIGWDLKVVTEDVFFVSGACRTKFIRPHPVKSFHPSFSGGEPDKTLAPDFVPDARLCGMRTEALVVHPAGRRDVVGDRMHSGQRQRFGDGGPRGLYHARDNGPLARRQCLEAGRIRQRAIHALLCGKAKRTLSSDRLQDPVFPI